MSDDLDVDLDGVDAALAWLYSTQMYGVKLGLESVERLMGELGLAEGGPRVIHVAGTNGKGSTCALVHALLTRGAGQTAGLFTSPHLIRFNERIRDGEREISGAEIADGLKRLRGLVAGWEPHPTFFELTFVLAMDWFRRRGVRWAVVETGLGGRLDATNVVRPEVTVITPIGYDHMEILGDSLAAIAGEKAGIVKRGVPLVTGPQALAARAVLRGRAEQVGAGWVEVTAPYGGELTQLPGEHQRWNAALAVAAVEAAGVEMGEEARTAALAGTGWPGRFQRVSDSLVLDAAHNAAGVEALVRTWREQFGDESPVLVFAVSREKDLGAMVTRLSELRGAWLLPPIQSPRARAPEEVAARIRQWSPASTVEVTRTLEESLRRASESGQRTLVVGSLFLIGEVLGLLEGGQFEVSGQ